MSLFDFRHHIHPILQCRLGVYIGESVSGRDESGTNGGIREQFWYVHPHLPSLSYPSPIPIRPKPANHFLNLSLCQASTPCPSPCSPSSSSSAPFAPTSSSSSSSWPPPLASASHPQVSGSRESDRWPILRNSSSPQARAFGRVPCWGGICCWQL